MKHDYDIGQIKMAIAYLIEPGRTFEVRILGNDKREKPISGYFRSADEAIAAFDTVDLRRKNVYVTVQPVSDDCYSRNQGSRFIQGAQSTTDNDIDGYRWLFVDIDAEHTSGVSSTDAELKKAAQLANRVYQYMHSLGFYEPLKAYSGNGCHLLYKVSLKRNDENERLIQRCLDTLSALFDDGEVKVDVVNFNPSRICKLYGTVARKGRNTSERPWRLSQIRMPEKDIEINPRVMLEKLAAQMPVQEEPRPAQYNNYSPAEFDVEQFLSVHGMSFTTSTYKDGTKYVLEHCPFDESHTAPDSAVFKTKAGALGFKCLHNSCRNKGWREFRLKLDPTAYEKKQYDLDNHIELGLEVFNRTRAERLKQNERVEPQSNDPSFLNMELINAMPEQELEHITTGITELDKSIAGLAKKGISVVTGLRGAAKSTLLSQIMLHAVDCNCNVVCYSGELSPQNFWRWLSIQAAGRNHMIESRRFSGMWALDNPALIKSKVASWCADRLWLYNNQYGNDFNEIAEKLIAIVQERKVDLLVIDNLMALDLTKFDSDKYDAQTKFVWKLKKIAIDQNCHVCFVAHPRKAMGFLRLDDIAGTGNIANAVDTALVVHRCNKDFVKNASVFDEMEVKRLQQIGATNCLEICKDRENGVQDKFIPLWFEGRSRRLLNSPDEYVHYGWEKLGEQQNLF